MSPSPSLVALLAVLEELRAAGEGLGRAGTSEEAWGGPAGACAKAAILASGFTGSLAALALAATHPHKVAALVLCDCHPPQGTWALVDALAQCVTTPVLLLKATGHVGEGAPGAKQRRGAGATEGHTNDAEVDALRSFAYCYEAVIQGSRDSCSAWSEAVLAHVARYDGGADHLSASDPFP